MQIEIPFNYINLLAFKILLQYENKRQIKIETLIKYQLILLQETIKKYEEEQDNDDIEHFLDKDKWKGKIEFTFDEDNNIDNFLEEFSHLFKKEQNKITLLDEVTYEDLNKEIITIENYFDLSSRFESAALNSEELFKLLNINTIRKALEKYIKIEQKLEQYYSKLNENNNTEVTDKINQLLFVRALFLKNIASKPRYIIDAFRQESVKLLVKDHEINPNYEYKVPPINLELFEQSKYYSDDFFDDIDARIYDIHQYAIFGTESSSIDKINTVLENLYFFPNKNDEKQQQDENLNIEDYFKTDEEDYEEFITCALVNSEESDLAFYLSYLNNLNKYINTFGATKELIETKNRLLYTLDMLNLGLFKNENFDQKLKRSKDFDLDEEAFDFISDEIRFMSDEIFQTENNINTVRKLLLISTYYELTSDREIKENIYKHKDHSNFNSFADIILKEEKFSSKKLTKKKNPNT